MEAGYGYTVFCEERPDWLTMLLEQADRTGIRFLQRHSRQYRELWKEQEELIRRYAKLFQLLEEEGDITLSAEEHAAFRRYQVIRALLRGLERDQLYWQGHRHCYLYQQFIAGAVIGGRYR